MAKEIVVWCEIHLAGEDRVPGIEHEVTVDGVTRTVDLCAECRAKHLKPIEDLLEEFGQPVVNRRGPYKKAAKAATSKKEPLVPDEDGKYRCTHPECGRSFDSAQGLGRHKASHRSEEARLAAAS